MLQPLEMGCAKKLMWQKLSRQLRKKKYYLQRQIWQSLEEYV